MNMARHPSTRRGSASPSLRGRWRGSLHSNAWLASLALGRGLLHSPKADRACSGPVRTRSRTLGAPRRRGGRLFCGSGRPFVVSILLSLFLTELVVSQTPSSLQGTHYYLVQDADTGAAVQRGEAGAAALSLEELILAPNRSYRIWIVNAAELLTGFVEVTTPGSGGTAVLPTIIVGTDLSADTDGDGLNDDGEFIMGTDSDVADTDGDGVLDGAEVQQGTDPLSGLAVRTGIIASADTPGQANDICVVSDMAMVADGLAGVSIFNVFNGMNPVLITQVDTPGDAMGVACGGGRLIAVADRTGGLVVIDLTDPPASSIAQQVLFGSDARCVAAAENFAFVGLANGQIAVVDMPSGTQLSRLVLANRPLQDLFLSGDYLYALVEGSLYTLSFVAGELVAEGSTTVPGLVNTNHGRMRLFVGGEIAYAVDRRGYNTVDVSLPTQPVLIQGGDTTQFGWKHIVANGSGLGVAARSPNGAFDGPHNVSIYDVRDPNLNNELLAQYVTPGVARAVSLYNGLAYVADHTAGLQVVNFLAYDNQGVPPTIALTTSFASGVAEEGQLMRVTAAVTDDVQVRNVEFYADGQKVATDGNFPFEHRLVTPLISSQRNSFTVRARASDTGGNATWSETLSLDLVPDATPPRVLSVQPKPGALLGNVDTLTAYFSEPVLPATLTASAFRVVAAGADGLPETADDVLVSGGKVSYRESLKAGLLSFPADLDPGLYRVSVGSPLTDQAGNAPTEDFSWSFRVFGLDDRDADGVPDELEVDLGLDPDNSDSDGDGIADGLEDFDNDGLVNAGEILTETDPRLADTDGNGVQDGAEDPDQDSLTNTREISAGTNPLLADSDGDGWNDESEVTGLSDPTDPASRPLHHWVAMPRVAVVLASVDPATAVRITIASPPVGVMVPNLTDVTGMPIGVTVAQPPVSVLVPRLTFEGEGSGGTTVARPPVGVVLPASESPGSPSGGVTVAQPPVTVDLNGP